MDYSDFEDEKAIDRDLAIKHIEFLLQSADVQGRLRSLFGWAGAAGAVGALEIASCIFPMMGISTLLWGTKSELLATLNMIRRRAAAQRALHHLRDKDVEIIFEAVAHCIEQIDIPLPDLQHNELCDIVERYKLVPDALECQFDNEGDQSEGNVKHTLEVTMDDEIDARMTDE